MPFPLPTPAELTRRAEALMEAAVRRVRPDADPAAIARSVRSPRGMLAAIIRVMVQLVYELHLHLRWWGDQYFPDTAEGQQAERHAAIWGVVRRPATKAIGYATVEGVDGTVIVEGAILVGAGSQLFEVTQGATVAGGIATITVRAQAAGADGNAAADTRLSFRDVVSGLDPQEAVVDASGLAGGAAIETISSLVTRYLAKIREPAHGGADADYPVWVQNAWAASHVRTLPNWVGVGTVGVVVAMGSTSNPRAPTAAEIEAIAAELETVRPVTAEVVVIAAELLAADITLSVDPDEVLVRQAISAAIVTFFAREATIGGKLKHSRISEAISAASGEYSHDLTAPAGDIVAGDVQLPVPGVITWVAAP